MASKHYGVNATIILFVFVLYCIITRPPPLQIPPPQPSLPVIHLYKRMHQNKQRLELADYEAENFSRLQTKFSRQWEFISLQAETQAKYLFLFFFSFVFLFFSFFSFFFFFPPLFFSFYLFIIFFFLFSSSSSSSFFSSQPQTREKEREE